MNGSVNPISLKIRENSCLTVFLTGISSFAKRPVSLNIAGQQEETRHAMHLTRLLAIAATFAMAGTASAATIGVVAPQSGPYEALGLQIRQGVKIAAAKAGLDVMEIHESCEEGSGAQSRMVWSQQRLALSLASCALKHCRRDCRPSKTQIFLPSPCPAAHPA